MATGRFGSPAKQTMKSGSNMTAAEKKAMNDKSAFGPDGKNVAKPPKGKSKSKYDQSPAKQMSQLKNNSPAKQKEQDPTQIPGNQVRSYSEKGSIRAPKVSYDMAYEKRDKKKYDMSKADYIKEAKRQTKSKLETNDWDSSPRKKVKKVTTLKAEGPKNEGGGLPVGKPIKAKEIKVTKKVAEAKPTRSQKIRAKGEAALASGKTDKAQRLRRRMDRTEAREEKRAGRKEARAAKKNKMAMTKSKVDKKAKPVKEKAMDSSRMEN
tara:strand:- start:54 stop:848 length:795 start_codon:yes stop_codon:yes gene_type:complete